MIRRTDGAFVVLLSLNAWLMLASSSAYAGDAAPDQVAAAAIAAQGDAKSGIPPCSSCHGNAGQGNPAVGFPRLAGLPAPYIERQLEALATKQRDNAMMHPVAKTLSPTQLHALAVY